MNLNLILKAAVQSPLILIFQKHYSNQMRAFMSVNLFRYLVKNLLRCHSPHDFRSAEA